MSEHERTERGFRIFGRVSTHTDASIRVQESSLAFEGAHVWLILEGEECREHLGRHHRPTPQLSVEQAKQLRDNLNEFIRAESGELMEPASRESDSS